MTTEPISFRDPFLTSDNPGGRNLQNVLTSGGQNIKSLQISHVSYQIIGFIGFKTLKFKNVSLLQEC